MVSQRGALAQLGARHIRIVEVVSSNLICSRQPEILCFQGLPAFSFLKIDFDKMRVFSVLAHFWRTKFKKALLKAFYLEYRVYFWETCGFCRIHSFFISTPYKYTSVALDY